jgi:diaminohydroxyphosphoribosylaminopyrimidine deaminase/5-amino-6-(5-phosphoribosylamino)uracil reductase
MVGAETLRADDPVLLPHRGRNDDLLRVVVTRSGNLPADAKVFRDGRNETVVFRVGSGGGVKGAVGAKNLRDALLQLGRRGIMHVLCEGGLKLAVSLAEAGLVDEWICVLAPCVIGSGPVERKKIFKPVGGRSVSGAGDDIIARFSCLRD